MFVIVQQDISLQPSSEERLQKVGRPLKPYRIIRGRHSSRAANHRQEEGKYGA
jgi:hypothetical protein